MCADRDRRLRTGYSSLSRLAHLPIDLLKIDRSFVNALDTASGAATVAAIIDLAHAINIHVIAEGSKRPDNSPYYGMPAVTTSADSCAPAPTSRSIFPTPAPQELKPSKPCHQRLATLRAVPSRGFAVVPRRRSVEVQRGSGGCR